MLTLTNSCSMERLYVHFYVTAKLMFALICIVYALGYCRLSLCTLVRLCCDDCRKRVKCVSLILAKKRSRYPN